MLQRFNDLRFHKKLLLAYFLLILLPILMIVTFVFADMIHSVKQEDIVRAESAFQQSLLSVDNYFNGYIDLSQTLATDTFLTGFLNKKYAAGTTYEKKHFDYSEVSRTYLPRFTYESLDGDVFTIKTGNRDILCYTNLFLYITAEDENTDWYKNSIEHPNSCILSAPVTNQGRKMLPMTLCLTPQSGIVNILKMDIMASNLCNVLSIEKSDKEFYIVNQDMVVLASHDYRLIGQNIESIPCRDIAPQLADLKDVQILQGDDQILAMGRVCANSILSDCYLIEIFRTTPASGYVRDTFRLSAPLWIAVLFLDMAMIVLFSRWQSRRISGLVQSVRKITEGDMDTAVSIEGRDEIAELSQHVQQMMDHINQLIHNVYESELQSKASEIRALQSQINPHFLFNCLQAINTSALKNGALETSDLIVNYSRVVRKSIEWKTDIVTIRQELDLVKDYLLIQRERFADRLQYAIQTDPRCEEARIPKFTIQPIVENALFHGVEAKAGVCRVNVSAMVDGNDLLICVEDTGIGMSQERLSHIRAVIVEDTFTPQEAHIGILNVHRRIRLLYGQTYGVSIESTLGEGTRVIIRLPFRQA